MRTIAHISALRPMDDSVNWNAIPTAVPLVAGYVPPSSFAWPAAAWTRFPNSIKVRITPSASVTGVGIQVLDRETGDAAAVDCPRWAVAQRALGQIPTVYCSASNWQAVQDAFNAARVAQPEYWIAAYPGGGQTLPSLNGITAVAHQYADPATSGGDWDSSVVAAFWPGVDDSGVDVTPEQDAMLRDIREQLCGQGARTTGQYPGWPGLGGKTVVDGLSVIGARANAAATAEQAGIATVQAAVTKAESDLLAAVRAVQTGQVDVTALATELVPLLSTADAHALLVALGAALPKA